MNIDNLQMEEYRTLKSELLANVDEGIKLEIYAVGAVAAFYAWLVSQHTAKGIVWFIPVGLGCLGYLRSWALLKRVRHISEYIRENIETRVGYRGWESFFDEHAPRFNASLSWLRKNMLAWLQWRLSWTVHLVWLTLLLLTLLLPHALWC